MYIYIYIYTYIYIHIYIYIYIYIIPPCLPDPLAPLFLLPSPAMLHPVVLTITVYRAVVSSVIVFFGAKVADTATMVTDVPSNVDTTD